MEPHKKVLLSTPVAQSQATIAACLHEGDIIDFSTEKQTLSEKLRSDHYDFIFIDIDMFQTLLKTGQTFELFLQTFWESSHDTEFIILCRPENVKFAVQAVRAGANSYLIYPIDDAEVRYLFDSIAEQKRIKLELNTLRDEFWLKEVDFFIKTQSSSMKKVIAAARSVARTNSTILLTGETGTGKNVLAKLIHQHSMRKTGPFISVHCGAIPENLIESELFGHEKGAFTGALDKKMGKFELAKGGTIFLDEVGTLSLGSQTKLLKVLQEKVIQRVGSEKDIQVDVRAIAAANRDLLKLCEKGEFRYDLYYRLNVFPIELPPLRDRKEDIPHLVQVFLKRLNASYGKGIKGVHSLALKAFQQYPWPGNIRELGNIVERAYIIESTAILSPQSFPLEIVPYKKDDGLPVLDLSGTLPQIRRKALQDAEIKYIKEKLTQHRGRIDKTAKEAGVSTRYIHKLMAKYGICRDHFCP